MKYILFALLLTLSALLPTMANDAYVVTGVTVTLEGDNPEALRADALKEAQTAGLAQLLQQMTPESDWGKHAWVLADETAANYIQSVSIEDESAADGAYEANFTVTFNANKTRRMLLKHKLNFSEAQNRQLLLVPLWRSADSASTSLTAQNPWRNTLQAIGTRRNQDLNITYLEELRRAITSAQALENPERLFKQLTQQHSNKQIAISVAEVTTVDATEQLTITTTFADARQMPIAFSLPMGRNMTSTLERAAHELNQRASTQLLTEDIIRADQEQVLFIRFKATRAQDIERMQQELANISVVADVSPRLISAAESVFMVHMYSDVPAFLIALERAGLSAVKQGNLYQVAFN